ncbi:MAG: O-methyltransferase [Clostridiales bacterium]|nr:O-methyltransferase [Clostridiales bacterium]
MAQFTYAHNDTSAVEKQSSTARFVKLKIDSKLQKLREQAFARHIPIANDETLNFLIALVSAIKPKRALELGSAVGVSGIAMLSCCPDMHLVTVEKEDDFYLEAKRNFASFGVDNRVNAILGDAGEVIEVINGGFDFIFLDSAKAQYKKYLPVLKGLLNSGGVLVADDILLYGWVNGEQEVPQKRQSIVKHVTEYIEAATSDSDLITSIINIGDGIALSVKK